MEKRGKRTTLRDFILDRVIPQDHRLCGFLWRMRQAKRYLVFDALTALKAIDRDKFQLFDELTQVRAIGKKTADLLNSKTHGRPSRILFFSMRAWGLHLAWENVLAAALRLRGAECLFYTCSGGLPLCGRRCMEAVTPTPCQTCARYSKAMFENLGHELHRLNEFAKSDDIARACCLVEPLEPNQFEDFSYKGLPLGRLVKVSVLHVLHAGQLYPDAASVDVYRKFLASGIVMTDVGIQLLAKYDPDIICMINGLLFAESIMYDLARQMGKRIVTHEVGVMLNTIMFSRKKGDIFDSDTAWERFCSLPLNEQENARLDRLLQSRRRSERDLSKLWLRAEEDIEKISRQLQVDKDRMVVTLFTSLPWDTSGMGQNTVFPSIVDWVIETVRFFLDKPEIQLIIRVHPVEAKSDGHISKEKLAEILSAHFPKLPKHIKVVAPESEISSYALMSISNYGLVYVSTVGLEMAVMGKPVIVPTKIHFACKGFTYDVSSKDEYFELLGSLAAFPPMSEDQIQLARRYAYLYFFQLTIPFHLVYHQPLQGPRFTFTDISELSPGKDKILDHICNAVLNGDEFALPRELVVDE